MKYFRAISVLLGEAWKGLQAEEREAFSQKAKVCLEAKSLITMKLSWICLDYGRWTKETSSRLLEAQEISFLCQQPLRLWVSPVSRRTSGGPLPAPHPQQANPPILLPDSSPQHQRGQRSESYLRLQRCRSHLGAQLQQITAGPGILQGGPAQTVHSSLKSPGLAVLPSEIFLWRVRSNTCSKFLWKAFDQWKATFFRL